MNKIVPLENNKVAREVINKEPANNPWGTPRIRWPDYYLLAQG